MRLVVLTPGIKEVSQAARRLPGGPDTLLYLTNPLYQARWAKDAFPDSQILEDDDISRDDRVFNTIAACAQSWAEQWSAQPGVREKVLYREIELGQLNKHALYHDLFGILKAISFYGILLRDRRPSEILAVDDGSWWFRSLRFLAERETIPFTAIPGDIRQPLAKPSASRARGLKDLLSWVNRAKAGLAPRGGILYSCALKFSEPLLKRGRGNYLLRKEFSAHAFQAGWTYSYTHLLPEYFARQERRPSPEAAFDLEGALAALQKIGEGGFFSFEGINAWPLLKDHFTRWMRNTLSDAVRQVDAFFGMLRRITPRAIVVDEDILFFNKALVSCARRLAIPTYTMLHGVPFTAFESMPTSDKTLAWGRSTRERLGRWGMNGDRVIETGAPQYDDLKKFDPLRAEAKVRRDFQFPGSLKIILLAVSNLHTNEQPNPKYPRISYFQKNLSGAVRTTLGCLERFPQAVLVIKSHPADRHLWFTRQIVEAWPAGVKNRVRIVQDYFTPDLIAAANLVLTTGSTVYFEALLMRRPALIYDYENPRFCSFMSEEFLNLDDPDGCQRMLAERLTAGRAEIAERQKGELGRHFHQSNECAVEGVLEALGR
ncbi:MAG: hypothetical protein ACREH5_02840 [Candidatus Omnitrophota bacterium]